MEEPERSPSNLKKRWRGGVPIESCFFFKKNMKKHTFLCSCSLQNKKSCFWKVVKNTKFYLHPPLSLEGLLKLLGNTKYAKNMKIEETKSRLEQLLERFHYFYIFENIVFVLLLLARACFQKKLMILWKCPEWAQKNMIIYWK